MLAGGTLPDPRSLPPQGRSGELPFGSGGVQSGLGEAEVAQFWGKNHRGRPCPVGQVPEPGPGFAHGSLWLFPAPQKASEGQDLEPDGRQEEEDVGDTHHVNARHLLYPNSHVTRFPVPNEKVPWEVSAGPGALPPGQRCPVFWTRPGAGWTSLCSPTGTCWAEGETESPGPHS